MRRGTCGLGERDASTNGCDMSPNGEIDEHTANEEEAVGDGEEAKDTLPTKKKLWLMEKKPRTYVKAGELVDERE